MKKTLLVLAFTALTTDIKGFSFNLPDGFCDARQVSEKKNCTLRKVDFETKTPVIALLIHGTFSSAEQFLDKIFINNDPIPVNFFKDPAYNGNQPIKLTYNWTGKNSDNDRIQAGEILAKGLNSIVQECKLIGVMPKIIILGHSHGGNVIAVASNSVTNPIDCAIMLGTPVLGFNALQKGKTANSVYIPDKILELFLFYSSVDFVQSAGSMQKEFKRRYGPFPGINLYNIHLLLKGQEPSHIALYTQLIEDNILMLCQKIKSIYTKNRNLVANIDPEKKDGDKLVAIKKYDPIESNPLAGVAIDSLWPDWTKFEYTPQEVNENVQSNIDSNIFYNLYGKEFTKIAPILDRVAQGAKQDICVQAVGTPGVLLNAAPKSARDAAGKLCCGFDEFKGAHPNAAQALQCSKITTNKETALTEAENKNLCTHIIGLGGRGLFLLPKAAKNDLKARCCGFDEFKNKHPNASKALGC